MLRHIVMWKFRPGTEAERDLFLTGLQGLYGQIPELKRCQVLRGMEGSNYDAALIADVADREALERYLADPRHQIQHPGRRLLYHGDPAGGRRRKTPVLPVGRI